MATENDLDVFARVVNGVITEYPVYRLHIKNRSHPLSWYTPVVEAEKPELPAFSYYKRNLAVGEGVVNVSYEIVSMSLAELLPTFKKPSSFPGEDDRRMIAECTQEEIQQVYVLGGQYVTAKLTAWARTRLYDDIKSLCDYRDSSFEKFRVEGSRGYYLRDKTWEAIIAYFNQVVSGQLPVPISLAEVDAILPELTWEDPEAPVEETPTDNEAPVVEDSTTEEPPVTSGEDTSGAEGIGDPVDPGTETPPDPVETSEPEPEEPVTGDPTTETPVEETPTEPETPVVP